MNNTIHISACGSSSRSNCVYLLFCFGRLWCEVYIWTMLTCLQFPFPSAFFAINFLLHFFCSCTQILEIRALLSCWHVVNFCGSIFPFLTPAIFKVDMESFHLLGWYFSFLFRLTMNVLSPLPAAFFGSVFLPCLLYSYRAVVVFSICSFFVCFFDDISNVMLNHKIFCYAL